MRPQGRSGKTRTSRVAWWLVVALCALLMLTACEVNAMGKMCLFSAVHGVVLDHGKPVAGATIERSYNWGWNGKDGGDQTTTDAQGAFALPAIWGSSLMGSLLPHEPSVVQTILIHHAGQTWKGWWTIKHDYDENGELDGRPISLICRLGAEPTRHNGFYGVCDLQ